VRNAGARTSRNDLILGGRPTTPGTVAAVNPREHQIMPYIRTFHSPGVTWEHYDAAMGQLGFDSEHMPEGCIVHVADEGNDGAWRVFEIWESKQAAHRFDEQRMHPMLARSGIRAPEPEAWEAHKIIVRGGQHPPRGAAA
jgi:hypothetical protein